MAMTRTVKNVGFTVPPSMAEELEQMAAEERRTKSELFREMFRVYRLYRKQIEKAEEEKLEELVHRALSEGQEEKERKPRGREELMAESERLARYGAEQAKKLAIQEEERGRIVDEKRGERGRS
jgi:hypothetical protein